MIDDGARLRFVARYGGLFEHSPWVAERTFRRGQFADRDELHRELCMTMRAASREEQLALIRAHPDLAGRLAQQGALTQASSAEQASAGLDRLEPQELERFQRLNSAYRERFGFPFVICARLNDRKAILDAMTRRLAHQAEIEFDTALSEIEQIVALRLAEIDSRP